jgi:hypothetical protein
MNLNGEACGQFDDALAAFYFDDTGTGRRSSK